MSLPRTFATAARILSQIMADHRSLALLLIAPSLLVGLFAWIFAEQDQVFQRLGPAILALFPFIVMFLITSITTLRERRSGTLERLMTMPIGKGDIIAGYALAFGLAALVQALITVAFAVGVCGLDPVGPLWQLGVVAVLDALLGTALGLLASAFARTEFQAVQLMPLIVFPQILLGGLIVPRAALPDVLSTVSDWLPLSYAIEAAEAVATGAEGELARPLLIVAALVLGSVVLASLTLSRRTA